MSILEILYSLTLVEYISWLFLLQLIVSYKNVFYLSPILSEMLVWLKNCPRRCGAVESIILPLLFPCDPSNIRWIPGMETRYSHVTGKYHREIRLYSPWLTCSCRSNISYQSISMVILICVYVHISFSFIFDDPLDEMSRPCKFWQKIMRIRLIAGIEAWLIDEIQVPLSILPSPFSFIFFGIFIVLVTQLPLMPNAQCSQRLCMSHIVWPSATDTDLPEIPRHIHQHKAL